MAALQPPAPAHTTVQPASARDPSYSAIPQGHSGRLKYAEPQDLPSYPSIGLKKDDAAASAAASLGWATQKPLRLWSPDKSSSASAAAMLAKDYKMAPLWQPSPSSPGKTAAVLAAGNATSRNRKSDSHLTPPSPWGNSAANVAFKTGQPSQPSSSVARPSIPPRESSSNATKGSTAAAAAATSTTASTNANTSTAPSKKTRPRSKSSPSVEKPAVFSGDAFAALSAATTAHRPAGAPKFTSADLPIEETGAVPYTTMSRQMFTSHPPVKPEVDEKRRNDVLHASAVAMARRMYSQQQKMVDATKQHQQQQQQQHARLPVGPADDATSPTMTRFVNLQEAAYRLAQERLAKLQDEHQKQRDFAEYYVPGSGATYSSTWSSSGSHQHKNRGRSGSGGLGTGPAGRLLTGGTMRPRHMLSRRRSSSDGDLQVDDRRRSAQIRSQMSLFSTQLSAVDEAKRERDRRNLLAAAQRNVRAELQRIDNRVAAETGMVPPSTAASHHQQASLALLEKSGAARSAPAATQAPQAPSELETRAHQIAVARSEARRERDANAGKVDIGGGVFMDRKAVDEIAARRVQPVLDEINERAERERERQVALRLEEERRQEEAERKRAREKEVADIHRKIKEQQKDVDRARKAEQKHEEKARKEEERAAKAEQKRLAKEEKRRSKESPREAAAATATTTSAAEDDATSSKPIASESQAASPPPDHPAEEAVPQPQAQQEGAENEKLKKRRSILHPLSPKLHSKQRDKEHKDEGKDKEIADDTAATSTATKIPSATPTAPSAALDKASSPLSEGELSPTSGSKVKSWIKSRFARPRGKSASEAQHEAEPSAASKRSFVGGAALLGPAASAARRGSGGSSSSGSVDNRSTSMREVAMAGRSGDEVGESSSMAASGAGAGAVSFKPVRPSQSGGIPIAGARGQGKDEDEVSSMSSSNEGSDEADFVLARDTLDRTGTLTAPRRLRDPATTGSLSEKSGSSPGRDSRFLENLD